MTVFVPNGENQGITATWLLHSADEADIDRRLIKTTRGGFNVPDELAVAIGYLEQSGPFVVAVPEVPAITDPATEEKTPPPGWDDPLPTPDVYLDADGKVYLTDEAQLRETGEEPITPAVEHVATPDVDREAIRAWAKDNGLKPAGKGALKKATLDAYHAAH